MSWIKLNLFQADSFGCCVGTLHDFERELLSMNHRLYCHPYTQLPSENEFRHSLGAFEARSWEVRNFWLGLKGQKYINKTKINVEIMPQNSEFPGSKPLIAWVDSVRLRMTLMDAEYFTYWGKTFPVEDLAISFAKSRIQCTSEAE